MKPIYKHILLAIGTLLLILGFGNIWDDSRVLVYDLTAILSGLGFIVLSRAKK
jgi:ABC-type transport system involved in multi-copper enzyme maturation permease subunit